MDRRKFIQVTGVSGIGVAGIGYTGSMAMLSCSSYEPDLEEQLKQQAFLAFQRFEEVWDFNDFWKRGNTFDACLVFADALNGQWPDDPQVKAMNDKMVLMLEQNLDFFNSVDIGGMWADDFGWWGLQALNARKFLLGQGETELADKFWHLSDELCWKQKRDAAYDHSPDALPVPHGCRNGDANGNSLGVKNTVTNVLLFLLSSRIYRLAKSENREDTDKYLEMAWAQWLWFSQWFELEEYEYLKSLSTDGALVQERPIAEFEGSGYTEKIHPPWSEGWVWTGDQGMLLAAITDMIAIKEDLAAWIAEKQLDPDFDVDAFEKEATGIIQTIGAGVKHALVAEVDGLIREAPCLSSFGPVHGRDYVAGRGIMMRYLGSEEIKSQLGVNLDQAVHKTVDAIWKTRNTDNNQFQPEYTTEQNDKVYVEQFRKLWGLADEVHLWDLEKMHHDNRDAVCQSVGMDMLGAAIKTL